MWLAVLAIIAISGLYGGYVVITEGLIVTGMNNMVVWGLWIAADLSFVALSAGAFTLSAIIYVFRMEKFRDIGRLAVFIGLIGNTLTMLTLVLDIGRPERFWFPILYWNQTSVLLEVFWCITMYTAVLTGEFIPTAAESPRIRRIPLVVPLAKVLHSAMPALAVAGAVFSLLHQSSLGALYGVVAGRPAWYGVDMPFLFLTSAMAAGPSLTIFASAITSRLTRREIVQPSHLASLAKIVGGILTIYLLLKLWNTLSGGMSSSPSKNSLFQLLAGTSYAWSVWGLEIALGATVPAAIFLVPMLRRSTKALFIASGLVVMGVIANRWNVTIAGQIAYDFTPISYAKGAPLPPFSSFLGTYIPAWPEWITVAGAVAFGLLVYSIGVKYLPVLPSKSKD